MKLIDLRHLQLIADENMEYWMWQRKSVSLVSVMKLVVILLAILLLQQARAARQIIFDSFEYSPEESDLIDYGTLTMKKVKNKNAYKLKGNFTFKRTLGNEKLVTFEIATSRGFMLARNTYAFCEFTRIDRTIWPALVKSSNMPQDNPCPFPIVSKLFTIKTSLLLIHSFRVITQSLNSSWTIQCYLDRSATANT